MEPKRKTRKNNGDGTVYQVNENKWVAKIQIGTKPDGKPDIKQFSATTQANVNRKLKEFKKTRGKYTSQNIKSISFTEYIDKWLYTRKRLELKDSSFDRLESTIKIHIKPNIGLLQMSKVGADDIQEIITNLYEKNLSYSTVKKVYDAFNACFEYAKTNRDIDYNPVDGVSKPSEKNFKTKGAKFFSEEEVKLLLAELKSTYSTGKQKYQYADAYILMLNTGIRMGECLGIHKEDISLEEKTLYIRRNVVTIRKRENKEDISEITGYEIRVQNDAKTNYSERIIDLNDNAIIAARSLLAKNPNSPLLVATKNDKVVSPSTFTKSFYAVLDNAGIGRCGLHTLRHTFASMLFKNGVNAKTVSEILGHSSVKITYDTYIHLIREQKQDAVRVLDALGAGTV